MGQIRELHEATARRAQGSPLPPEDCLDPEQQEQVTELISGQMQAVIAEDGEWSKVEVTSSLRLYCAGLGAKHHAFHGDVDFQLEYLATVHNYHKGAGVFAREKVFGVKAAVILHRATLVLGSHRMLPAHRREPH